MLPLQRFSEALAGYRDEINQQFNDLIMAANLLSKRTNAISREDNGLFHIQVSGTIDECISTLKAMTAKMEKIKEQRV